MLSESGKSWSDGAGDGVQPGPSTSCPGTSRRRCRSTPCPARSWPAGGMRQASNRLGEVEDADEEHGDKCGEQPEHDIDG